jgi:hypothetical protein
MRPIPQEITNMKIIVGLSRKRPGPEQYSSDGFHLTVELEKEISDQKDFHQSVRGLFAEVSAALDAEITHPKNSNGDASSNHFDLWKGNGGNGDAPASRNDNGHGQRGARNNGSADNNEPISNKQAAYLTQLLAKRSLGQQSEIAHWLHENCGVTVSSQYDLTKRDASRAIEILAGKQGVRR